MRRRGAAPNRPARHRLTNLVKAITGSAKALGDRITAVRDRLSGPAKAAMDRLTAPAKAIPGRFSSTLHDERVASWLGIWLGIAFSTAFATGLISHFMQHPPSWMQWPARPVNLYRLTQGLHVVTGMATIPLLLAKLWTVYPKLWQWPPFRSAGHALSRALVLLLIAGAFFQLATGLMNIAYWYPFPFFFTVAHYWTAYIVFGALVIHVANEWATVRRNLSRPGAAPGHALDLALAVAEHPARPALGRRGFFAMVAAASGTVALVMVGEAYSPLAGLAVLAPRRPGVGPQKLPVNRSALAAQVTTTARDPGWRLAVTGRVRHELSLSLADLRSLPRQVVRLPISCVEGWSADATWAGVRLRDVLAQAGAATGARVQVESLEQGGNYRTSLVDPWHWQDPLTLLALELNGEPLDLDHGYPCRLIAPDRPGVLQTKWLQRMVVV